MNRLFYSNNAIQQLSSARNNKLKLLRLDRELSSIQTNIFILRLKETNGIELQLAQFEAQRVENERNHTIATIASDIYNAIDNAIKAIHSSVQEHNAYMVMLDDQMLLNIANFINEYYKNDEIKSSIKDRIRFSLISHNIIHLSMNSGYFMPGLQTLQQSIM